MALVAAFFVAALGWSAAVAAEPDALKPTDKWTVNFDDAQCVATRSYGSGDERIYLAIKTPPLGNVVQLAIMRNRGSKNTDVGDATVRPDEGRAIKTGVLMYAPKTGDLRVRLLNLPVDDFQRVRDAKSLSIRSPGLSETFSLSGMTSLMKVMDRCVSNLREVWNVNDPGAEESSARVGAKPAANLASFFSSDDYPSIAIRNGDSGTVKFTMLIDEQGRVADCTIIETSGVAVLDAQTCIVMNQRAKFEPARGADGKTMKAAVTSRITWRMRD